MSKKYNHYIGKAGHLAAMSEFLMRGWNVAIPEVDIGDDIFVVQDNNGILRRVQVKTSKGKPGRKKYSAQFSLNIRNLEDIPRSTYYLFLVRINNIWNKPVIIKQEVLLDYYKQDKIGSTSGNNIVLYFSYTYDSKLFCNKLDFSSYISDFSDFGIIEH